MSRPRFLLHTEDSGVQADVVLEALVRKLICLIEPLTQPQFLDFVAARGPAKAAWEGHRWRERTPRGEVHRRTLINHLATQVKNDVVVLHHDGDAAWGDDSDLKRQVEGLLADLERRLGEPLPSTLLRMVPHWSIESWLYLNRAEVIRLDKLAPPTRTAALAWLDEHRHPNSGYDHVRQPKDACHPLNDRWNAALATAAWPVEQAASSPSWKATQDAWAGSAELVTLLKASNPWISLPEPP